MNAARESGITPIACAALRGHSDAITVLLNAGADPQKANSRGVSALFHAAQGGHVAAVLALLQIHDGGERESMYMYMYI